MLFCSLFLIFFVIIIIIFSVAAIRNEMYKIEYFSVPHWKAGWGHKQPHAQPIVHRGHQPEWSFHTNFLYLCVRFDAFGLATRGNNRETNEGEAARPNAYNRLFSLHQRTVFTPTNFEFAVIMVQLVRPTDPCAHSIDGVVMFPINRVWAGFYTLRIRPGQPIAYLSITLLALFRHTTEWVQPSIGRLIGQSLDAPFEWKKNMNRTDHIRKLFWYIRILWCIILDFGLLDRLAGGQLCRSLKLWFTAYCTD